MERAKCSFDVAKMMGILDGDPASTFKRQWIQGSHDTEDQAEAVALPPVEVHAELSREKNIAESMKHFMDIHWPHLQRGYRPKGQDMTFMSNAKFGRTGPLSLHYGKSGRLGCSPCALANKRPAPVHLGRSPMITP